MPKNEYASFILLFTRHGIKIYMNLRTAILVNGNPFIAL